MSTRKRRRNKQNLFRKIWRLSNNLLTRIFKWLLRCYILLLRGSSRQQLQLAKSGFILPTVAMVTLVVVLLTTALVFRSFDRAGKASNVRVNQAVLKAAEPALDRARAKIEALLNDSTLPRATPSDTALYQALDSTRYKLGDETRLKLVNDFGNGQGSTIKNNQIESQSVSTASKLEYDETLTTAWKFPVDTDNNGKYDSYSLYAIYFRSPTRGSDGKFNRARNSLEARTPPMSGGQQGSQCTNELSTSASSVGDSNWFKSVGKLKKSFFVYAATVPITSPPSGNSSYEAYRGNKGFSALEFQQDRSRVSLSNNAVVFQDDLEITPGPDFRLNGRIFTNANLFAAGRGGAGQVVKFYQVSSKYSCFYEEENGKITVGGNVGTGNLSDSSDRNPVVVDLFRGYGEEPSTTQVNSTDSKISGDTRSTGSPGGSQIGYNDAAYNRRIALMKQSAFTFHPKYDTSTKKINWAFYSNDLTQIVQSVNSVSRYPSEVKSGFKKNFTASLNPQDVLDKEIETYLKNRTRRVPYAEVSSSDGTGAKLPYDSDGDGIDTTVFPSNIEPPADWRQPIDSNNKLTGTTIAFNTNRLPQTQPETQRELGIEQYLGDRVYVGNNLPAFWKNSSNKYVTGPYEPQYLDTSVKWNDPSTQRRYRTTQVAALPDLGITERNGFWEDAAAQTASANSNTSGLRVITGAGIYVDDDSSATVGTPSFARSTYSFLNAPTLDSGVTNPSVFTTSSITSGNENIVAWYDTMPMTGGADEIAGSNRKGDLQMRATAVYHYKHSGYTTGTDYINRTPMVCVSSYYDPTNTTTAKNSLNTWAANYDASGRSNNGIVYSTPYNSDSDRISAVGTYRTKLNRQARLIFPNGRIVNRPLRDALAKIDASGTRSLADNSALDTAICALKILDGTLSVASGTPAVPHGAIKEASFLNAREVKAIEKENPVTSTNYDLELEQRQPLEIRVTDIDLSGLRQTTVGSTPQQEYLLPNSGIIYATRDDALLDASDTSAESKLLSPTDFNLDFTRRPNGIRLINGSNLARDNNYRDEEKGLILVTNLPAYVKGNFNMHQKAGTTATLVEEFTEFLDNTWSNFYTRAANLLDNDFACRKNQPGCGSNGDQWRPATIFSDAISLQSGNFQDGFRNQGDYDLNNNGSSNSPNSSIAIARQNSGFWDNNFVTSALWWKTSDTDDSAYPAEKTTDSYVGSYLTNGVTPVQRRVDFPEYVMEICRKIPVSQCKASDWVVGYDTDNNGSLSATEKAIQVKDLPASAAVARIGAGTTARAALEAADRRYARRLAFKRISGNRLVLTFWTGANEGQATPIPLGINSSNQVAEFPYTSTAVPQKADNALWFRTTTNTNGRPFCNGNNNPTGSGCTSDDRTYADDKPLYYDGKTRLTSPPTPEIPGVPSLNLPDGNPASGYTVCTNQNTQAATKKPSINDPSDLNLDKCEDQPGNPMAQINTTRNFMVNKTKFGAGISGAVTPTRSGTSGKFPADAGTTTVFTSNPAAPSTSIVNVIELDGGSFDTNGTCTKIELVGNENSIFVFRQADNKELSFGGKTSDCGVQLVLTGVDPNNVFWAINGNVKWNEVDSANANHHKMAGTFLTDNTGSPKWETVDFDAGGRLLGPNVVPPPANFKSSSISAIASNGQPLLVPVLQVHTPKGIPGNTLNVVNGYNEWRQRANTDTTFNAAFVSGNSPGRPGEDAAGLHNFVRFMEHWGAKVKIKGSFIQMWRSAFATGPFAQTRSDSGNLSIFGYISTPEAPLYYYNPPERQWGFDVALLSYPPDLFAQRFTQQSTALPDEYMREVGRDDSWIQTLLCAAQGSGTNYTYAVDQSERPSCPFDPDNSTNYDD